MATGVSYFDDQGDGPPTANTSIIYLAAGSSDNFFEFNLGDTPVMSFDNKEPAVEGTISLLYGSFTDPSNVPVTVEDNLDLDRLRARRGRELRHSAQRRHFSAGDLRSRQRAHRDG
jgi:hypothetical protein